RGSGGPLPETSMVDKGMTAILRPTPRASMSDILYNGCPTRDRGTGSSMSNKPSVLIVGASGALGQPLTQEFIKQRDRIGRLAILSDPAKAHRVEAARAAGVEIVLGSLIDPKCYQGIDIVFSLVGDATMRLQPAIIEAAVEGGVRHFYPSEFGTDIDQDHVWPFRYFRDKLVTRDHLRATAKKVPGFQYTLMLVGAFTEWSCSSFSGFDLEKHTVEAYGYPEAQVSVTALKDIVRYAVDSIFLPFPKDHAMREIRVRGDHVTFAELIKTLEEVQGVSYTVSYIDPSEAAVKQEAARKRGEESEEVKWAGKTICPTGRVTVPLPIDNDKFDFRPESLKETLARLFTTK
ncbi:unnamed protein product, partial [Mycena citricolor]